MQTIKSTPSPTPNPIAVDLLTSDWEDAVLAVSEEDELTALLDVWELREEAGVDG